MSDINFCKNCQQVTAVTEEFYCADCGEEICIICGCTESEPCLDFGGDSCHWVRPGVCSECADEAQAMAVNSLMSGMKE